MLPDDFDQHSYWQTIYGQPLAYWQPALEVIRERHGLPVDTWERFALGRNVVFSYGSAVVKLGPPFWRGEIPREADALQFVQGQLPVTTPELLAVGEIASWGYLVQSRLPGELLRSRWPTLEPAEKVSLARQHGQVMAAVHALPAQSAPASLAFDWPAMLAEQWAECAPAMQKSGVSAELIADLPSYLEDVWPLLTADRSQVLVHGDLDAINLLVERRNERWRITGLVDWGDVKLGPLAHEFISPRVHMYREERDPLPWYEGYGLASDHRTPQLERDLMARTLLYYADEFGFLLSKVPGAQRCKRWSEVAACFWHMTTPAHSVRQ